LAGTTGLLLVGVAEGLNRLADGLTVGNLWVTDVGLNLELALHAVNEDVEVQLAHAADDGLAGLLVQVDGEGGVLFSELLDGDTPLLLVRLGLRLDGNLDNRIREVHRLQDDRVGSITEGVTGGGVLQTDEGVDVASVCDVNRVFLVGVHLEQLADALLLTLGGVQNLLARLDLAGVDADEGQLAEERVCCDLEGQCGQWLIVGRLTGQGDLWVLHVDALDLTGVQWGREVVDDSVEQRLDTLVLVGGATEQGVDLGVDNHLADSALDLSDGQFLATEVLLHELFIRLSNGLDKLLAVLLRTLEQIRWDLLDGCVGTDRGDSTPGESLHLKKVDD